MLKRLISSALVFIMLNAGLSAKTLETVNAAPELLTDSNAAGIYVSYNGSEINFSKPPAEQNGFVFFPLEEIFQALCGSHNWDEENETLSGQLNGNIVEVPIKGSYYWVNGIRLDTPMALAPFVKNDTAYAYLDFIVMFLGLSGEWDDVTKTMTIMSKENATYWDGIDNIIMVEELKNYIEAQKPLANENKLIGVSAASGVETVVNEKIVTSTETSVDSSRRKTAYITIDDGPSRNNTPQILDILSSYNIKATFFVLPHDGVDDIYKRIYNEGHAIGNHSYSHNYSLLYDSENLQNFKDDISRMHEYIKNKTGYETRLFRFPGGSGGRSAEILNQRVEFLNELGYRYFNWDATTGDTDTSPAGKDVTVLVNNVVNNAKNREKLVILMHDSADKAATVKALPIIIEKLSALNYEFDTLLNY